VIHVQTVQVGDLDAARQQCPTAADPEHPDTCQCCTTPCTSLLLPQNIVVVSLEQHHGVMMQTTRPLALSCKAYGCTSPPTRHIPPLPLPPSCMLGSPSSGRWGQRSLGGCQCSCPCGTGVAAQKNMHKQAELVLGVQGLWFGPQATAGKHTYRLRNAAARLVSRPAINCPLTCVDLLHKASQQSRSRGVYQ
jgi:hypothetical protein